MQEGKRSAGTTKRAIRRQFKLNLMNVRIRPVWDAHIHRILEYGNLRLRCVFHVIKYQYRESKVSSSA